MRRWRLTSGGMITAIASAAVLSACGGQASQDASEPSRSYPVQITTATFPTSQRLSQHTHLVIAVRNAGHKAIPNLAVTILDPKHGTSVQAFSDYNSSAGLASQSRAVWIVDRPPGLCGYSCFAGGPGADVTAMSNTWAIGHALKPGRTARFDWAVTAVKRGRFTIKYEVAAGLYGKAKAQLDGGGTPSGEFTVTISPAPAQAYVDNNGQVVTTASGQ